MLNPVEERERTPPGTQLALLHADSTMALLERKKTFTIIPQTTAICYPTVIIKISNRVFERKAKYIVNHLRRGPNQFHQVYTFCTKRRID